MTACSNAKGVGTDRWSCPQADEEIASAPLTMDAAVTGKRSGMSGSFGGAGSGPLMTHPSHLLKPKRIPRRGSVNGLGTSAPDTEAPATLLTPLASTPAAGPSPPSQRPAGPACRGDVVLPYATGPGEESGENGPERSVRSQEDDTDQVSPAEPAGSQQEAAQQKEQHHREVHINALPDVWPRPLNTCPIHGFGPWLTHDPMLLSPPRPHPYPPLHLTPTSNSPAQPHPSSTHPTHTAFPGRQFLCAHALV